jgi:hypothetical protein
MSPEEQNLYQAPVCCPRHAAAECGMSGKQKAGSPLGKIATHYLNNTKRLCRRGHHRKERKHVCMLGGGEE